MNSSEILNIVFIHYDLPGQFIHLLRYLANNPQYNIYGICHEDAEGAHDQQLYQQIFCYQAKQIDTSLTHHYVTDLQRSVLNAQAVVEILQRCQQQDIYFDLAIAHTGWGEALYFKDIFPNTPLIGYVEFFFHAQGADAGFDPRYPITSDRALQIKTLNAQLLLGMNECDALITPTNWQKSLFPDIWHSVINVIHEGVDIQICKPDHSVVFSLPNGKQLTRKDEVVTYSARNLEPYRGFPVLLKVIELITQRRPNCHVIITGGDEVSYSKRLPEGECYRKNLLKKTILPPDRVHFLGKVNYKTHLQILQLSSVHIYLTYPFVLSWSFIEAMACECVIIASDTQPVMDVLEPENNGIVVNFFDYLEIADQVNAVFNHPQRKRHLGKQARKKIEKFYHHKFSINRYLHLFQQLLQSTHA